jgi:hypothetical protein
VIVMANPMSKSRKELRQELAAGRRRLEDLARQLSEARMLEALSQQLDQPDAWRTRAKTVSTLEQDLVTTHKSVDALAAEYTTRFGDDADFWTCLKALSLQEREREKKEDVVRKLQADLLSAASKLADLNADLPDELELFYAIKHARGCYGDAILITPHLTLNQAKRQYRYRESDRSLDHRGKYGVCAQYAVADRDPKPETPTYGWHNDNDMQMRNVPKHTALYIPK